MARPNAPSKVGKVKVQISDKWREEDIVAEDQRMNKSIVHRGKSNITFVPLMQLKAKKKNFFLAQLHQIVHVVKAMVFPESCMMSELDHKKG